MAPLADRFAERFHTLANEELLALATERDELLEAASLALQRELDSRGLGLDAVEKYASQQGEQVDAQPEESNETATTTPVELPDDWFDREDDPEETTPSSNASRRPKGITVLAYLLAAPAIFMLWSAFIFTSTAGIVLSALMMLADFIIGVGLWQLRTWALKGAIAVLWAGIGLNSLTIILTAIARLRGFAVEPMAAIPTFVCFLWHLLWLSYLGRARTREAFKPVSAL